MKSKTSLHESRNITTEKKLLYNGTKLPSNYNECIIIVISIVDFLAF